MAEMTDINELRRLAPVGDERDALRAKIEATERMVVTTFSHDVLPTFRQGVPTHELEDVVTADQCRWLVEEIRRLRAKIEQMERQEPVANVWRCDNGHIHGSCEQALPMGTNLYALPGAKGEEK